jgi:hypothetical protein
VKRNLTHINGPLVNGDGDTVSAFLSALSNEQYNNLVGFARYRIRTLTDSRWLQRCLALIDGEGLVAHCLLKLQLGEADPSLGRRLKRRNRASLQAFMACVKGIIESDIHRMVAEARNRCAQLPPVGAATDPCDVNPPATKNSNLLFSRRDLHRVILRKLRRRLSRKPVALLPVIRDFGYPFPGDQWNASEDHAPSHLLRVQQLTSGSLAELAAEFSPALDGEEMLL